MRNRLIIAVLLLLVVGYGAFKASPLILGPHITISELKTDENGLTVLSGTAIHTETLAMGGGTVLIDSDGAFRVARSFPRGGVILTLTATDRFGRSHSLERTVVTP